MVGNKEGDGEVWKSFYAFGWQDESDIQVKNVYSLKGWQIYKLNPAKEFWNLWVHSTALVRGVLYSQFVSMLL